MTCAMVRERLGAYIDGELPPDEAGAVAEHLASCAACSREYEAMLDTVRTVREGLMVDQAPDVLRARIRAAIREEGDVVPPRRGGWRFQWRVAAAALLVAVVSSGVTLAAVGGGRGARASESQLAGEVLASHVRSLMPEHLTDIRSTDQHNVKPWFNGRLDFSPSVPRLDEAGFPLLGGRVDYVHGRPVAVVVYGRRQHLINLFSWPAEPGRDAEPAQEARNGYNMIHWARGGVEEWAVSDLNAGELGQFVGLLRGGANR